MLVRATAPLRKGAGLDVPATVPTRADDASEVKDQTAVSRRH
jgi:hypothetical protein